MRTINFKPNEKKHMTNKSCQLLAEAEDHVEDDWPYPSCSARGTCSAIISMITILLVFGQVLVFRFYDVLRAFLNFGVPDLRFYNSDSPDEVCRFAVVQ